MKTPTAVLFLFGTFACAASVPEVKAQPTTVQASLSAAALTTHMSASAGNSDAASDDVPPIIILPPPPK